METKLLPVSVKFIFSRDTVSECMTPEVGDFLWTCYNLGRFL